MDAMPTSPFLPGTKIQYAWDSTSLGYLKTCPKLYYYHMIEGWEPRDESIHLRFGAEYHYAIQDFEIAKASGIGFEDAVRIVVAQLLGRIREWKPDPMAKAADYKNRDSLLHLVIAYMDEYRDDPCETVILENGRPAVEMSFRFELDWGPSAGDCKVCGGSGFSGRGTGYDDVCGECGGQKRTSSPYILCGHLDRVVNFGDSVFVVDHKTTATTPSEYYFNQFSPNNQMTLYTFAGKVIFEMPIAGVIIEAAQVTKLTPMKFIRRPTYRNDAVIDEWLDDLEYHLSNAEAFAEANHWPMNDTACDKFGGCRFREVCSKSPVVRERFLEAEFVKLPENERWNPLRAR